MNIRNKSEIQYKSLQFSGQVATECLGINLVTSVLFSPVLTVEFKKLSLVSVFTRHLTEQGKLAYIELCLLTVRKHKLNKDQNRDSALV